MNKPPPPANTRPWRAIIIAVVVCAAIALLYQRIDLVQVRDYAERLNGFIAFALLVVLPLAGFPVTVLHIAAGVRFGIGLGLTLVGVSIVVQLFASYALVHLFRRRFTRWFEPLQKRIPNTAHGTMCLFTLLLPGVPYFAKNYVLPLVGVPLRTYIMWCLPIHCARAAMAVVLGDQSDHLTPERILGLAIYGLTVVGASWLMWRRLRSQFADQPSAADDRKQPA